MVWDNAGLGYSRYLLNYTNRTVITEFQSFNISVQAASAIKYARKRSISVGSIDPPMAGHNKQYILLLIRSCIGDNNIDGMGKKKP